MSDDRPDRRRYPRVKADVGWQPAGLSLFHHRRNVSNVSLSGMRAYSDTPMKVGLTLECEVGLADQHPIRAWGRVVWCDPVEVEGVALYDAGIEFTDVDPAELRRLAAVMERDPEG